MNMQPLLDFKLKLGGGGVDYGEALRIACLFTRGIATEVFVNVGRFVALEVLGDA